MNPLVVGSGWHAHYGKWLVRIVQRVADFEMETPLGPDEAEQLAQALTEGAARVRREEPNGPPPEARPCRCAECLTPTPTPGDPS